MFKLKITEHTSRPDFVAHLKANLGSNFFVFQELSHDNRTPDILILRKSGTKIIDQEDKKGSGRRNMYIQGTSLDNAVLAVIETKQQGAISLSQNEVQLSRYCEKLKCDLGFLTDYERLIFYNYSTEKIRNYDTANMNEIAQNIAKQIEEETNIARTKKPDEILKLLGEHIDQLVSHMDDIPYTTLLSSDFKDENSLFNKNVLKGKLGDQFVKRTVAYIGILQLLFYSVYRMYVIDEGIRDDFLKFNLRSLAVSFGVPSNIKEILDYIPENINFQSIFNMDIFSHLNDSSSADLLSIISSLEGISKEYVISHELMGQIFQKLMPYEKRKEIAAYYTKPKAAELLTKLSITNKDQVIYDPACGSGQLLTAAYSRKKALGLKKHENILDQVKGSDISDIAAVMATVNLAIQNPSQWVETVSIYRTDFFRLLYPFEEFSGGYTYYAYSNTGEKQVKRIYRKLKENVDVVLANPPFTRGSRLPEKTRRQLKALTSWKPIKNFKSSDFGRVNLYSFFLSYAPLFTKKNGTLAFVLPLSAITAEHMVPVWRHLFRRSFGMKYLIEASDIEKSFSESSEQEIMAILQKGYDKKAKICKLRRPLNEIELNSIISEIETVSSTFSKSDNCILQCVDQEYFKQECTLWRTNPSRHLALFYQHFIPLNNKMLSPESFEDSLGEDLHNLVSLVRENDSRPTDYWFIPNKFWTLESVDDEKLIVKATAENIVMTSNDKGSQKLLLPRANFLPALYRKSKFYNQSPRIVPKHNGNSFFLISEEGKGLSEWLKWKEKAKRMQLFSTNNIKSHLSEKNRTNMIGIRKKVSFKEWLALRFKEPVVSSRIIHFGFTGEEDAIDLLFAYLTSSVFLLDALEKRMSRAGRYSIIYPYAIHKIYRFPNLTKLMRCCGELVQKIVEASYALNTMVPDENFPSCLELIKEAKASKNHKLRKLDELWFEVYNIPKEMIGVFYEEIEERLEDFE